MREKLKEVEQKFEELTRRLEHLGWDELHLALLDAFPADDSPTRP